MGTSFHCPLAWWRARETHLVVRSGRDGLGEWVDEQRTVHADYRAAIGGNPPARVTAIWLIAVSIFQQQAGRCDYAEIAIGDDDRTATVL